MATTIAGFAVYRRALVTMLALLAGPVATAWAANPWDDDPAVQRAAPRLCGLSRPRHRRASRTFFVKENGEWRHDLRHANVISVE